MPRDRRTELLRDAVVEAARAVMAQTLLRERRLGALADLTMEEQDALQTLRDSLAAERKVRAS